MALPNTQATTNDWLSVDVAGSRAGLANIHLDYGLEDNSQFVGDLSW